jgi:hypothetical protein
MDLNAKDGRGDVPRVQQFPWLVGSPLTMLCSLINVNSNCSNFYSVKTRKGEIEGLGYLTGMYPKPVNLVFEDKGIPEQMKDKVDYS